MPFPATEKRRTSWNPELKWCIIYIFFLLILFEMFVNLTLILNLVLLFSYDLFIRCFNRWRLSEKMHRINSLFFPPLLTFLDITLHLLFLYCLNLTRLWLVKPLGGAKDHKSSWGFSSDFLCFVIGRLDIFRCRFVLCVCPGLCKYISIYTARSMCCCMFAPFLLARLFEPFSCDFMLSPSTHTNTQLHNHTHTHTRVEAQLTHPHNTLPPPPPCVLQFVLCTDICLVSLQSRKAKWSDKEHWE